MSDPQPFSGFRVIDFTRVVSGPYATAQLAMLGADVIKVESPGSGDEARQMTADAALAEANMAPMYMACAINKRSVALDLKNPAARAAAEKLVLGADIIVENFRPGVMDRLGLSYESLAAQKPSLVWCSISGFGQTGPRTKSAAYDARLQAMSGLMSITGQAESGPVRAGYAVVDAATGMAAAFAVASAMLQRERTGQGQWIDVPMLDTALSHMAPSVAEWSVSGILPGLAGNQGTSGRATANLFRCRDGHIMMAANNERQYQALAEVIAAPELLTDPRFKDWPTRKANVGDLRAIIEAKFAEADGADLEARLDAAGVPASRVRDMAASLDDPQVAHRGLMTAFDADTGGLERDYTLVGAPFSFANGGPTVTSPPPRVGQDTIDVLREAGLSEAEITSATS
ncbi:MAG: CaiB/BaiF CoA transferase family protein [Alphaproteobacteria bacterium]